MNQTKTFSHLKPLLPLRPLMFQLLFLHDGSYSINSEKIKLYISLIRQVFQGYQGTSSKQVSKKFNLVSQAIVGHIEFRIQSKQLGSYFQLFSLGSNSAAFLQHLRLVDAVSVVTRKRFHLRAQRSHHGSRTGSEQSCNYRVSYQSVIDQIKNQNQFNRLVLCRLRLL